MIIGLDFGTTNTGAAVFDGQAVHLIPLDPYHSNPAVCRSAIYITRGREFYLGSRAVNLYFHQNVGRPTRYRKVWVGEILQVFAELPAFYRDVYVYEDEFSPGRLFLSVKTALRNPNYLGTVFQDQWFSASDLAAVFLMSVKQQADRDLQQPVKQVVLGRPVHFSNNPDEDNIAQSRLIEAALKAGFEKVYLEYEPVAAALAYERTLDHPETVLVFDFGGGTLDFTVIEIGQDHNDRQRQVLATGGIPIAGDIFDQRLFRATIPPHLGEGDVFIQAGKRYPVPAHIFDLLTNPQEILALNTPQNLEMLRSIHLGAAHPEKIQTLRKIVSSNYALLLFDIVEQAKCELSEEMNTQIVISNQDFTIRETVTRRRFERAIRHEYEAIRSELLATIERSNIHLKDIDRVIRTGGSSQIPLFANLLNEIFGHEKVQAIDVFSSVTSGLGIRAREVQNNQVDLNAWTENNLPRTETLTAEGDKRGEASPVNLDIVRQRLEVAQDFVQGEAVLPDTVFLALGDGNLEICGFNSDFSCDELSIWANQGVLAPVDQQILLATDGFKLMSRDLASFYIARAVGVNAIYDLLSLEGSETISALTAWDPANLEKKILCLVTSTGHVRGFDASLMANHIQPRPYFQLEKRYTGVPTRLMIIYEQDVVLVGTNRGRIGCLTIEQATVVPWEALRTKTRESVTSVGTVRAGNTALAVNEDGKALVFNPEGIPAAGSPASRGILLRRNFQTAGFVSLEGMSHGTCTALTNWGRHLALNLPKTTLKAGEPFQVVSLNPEERLINCMEVEN